MKTEHLEVKLTCGLGAEEDPGKAKYKQIKLDL